MNAIDTGKRYFTSGQVAKFCGVSTRVVSNWFDAGILTGWRFPGSGDRRYCRNAVIDFMRSRGISTDGMPTSEINILVVSPDAMMRIEFVKCLNDKYVLTQVLDTFSAGVSLSSTTYDAVVIDFAIGRGEAVRIMKHIKSKPDCKIVCIGIAGEDEPDPQSYVRPPIKIIGKRNSDAIRAIVPHFDIMAQHPVDIDALTARIWPLLEGEA